MGDENPIRTLGDYSKPSHEGYMNTIELPVGNNVVPLPSDTIRLLQNGCSFHGLLSEDPNQHLKNFLKLVDSLDLDGENRERTRLHLFQFSLRDQDSNWLERLLAGSITTWEDLTTLPHHGIDLWLQVQIFYNRVDHTLKRTVDYAARGRLRKMSTKKAWATIEELARYEEEGWNDPVTLGKGSLNYENPNFEQLLGVIECKVDTLMKEAILLMGRSESVFGMTSNTVYQLPSKPSRQEEFEDLVMNFILDQEEKVRKLEEYMCLIGSDYMQLSLEVVGKLREEIRIEQNRTKKIKKVTSVRHPTYRELHLDRHITYTPLVTYLEEVEKTLGIPIEVEPLNETKLEEVGLNCNHNTPLSSREVPSFDGPEPQSLLNSPSLDVIFDKKKLGRS
ncbi:hypothetical protein Tco_1220354 [Tanacetum coccineum]